MLRCSISRLEFSPFFHEFERSPRERPDAIRDALTKAESIAHAVAQRILDLDKSMIGTGVSIPTGAFAR
jgi:hypothetical protein